jgi:hypothetical protein
VKKEYLEIFEKIDGLIRLRSTGSPTELGRGLGFSRASIFEYINDMKELGAPIKYNRLIRTYYYFEDGEFIFQFRKSKPK